MVIAALISCVGGFKKYLEATNEVFYVQAPTHLAMAHDVALVAVFAV
jgi:hypothetical protein